jgi:5-methylcytosine-specific restriction endonuclease McrA
MALYNPIIYSKHQEHIAKTFNCGSRASDANKRFEDKITTIDVVNAIIRFNYKCIYCGDALKSTKWQLDHFYSRAMGGKNVFTNLVPACKWCNISKSALDGHAYIAKCKKVAENNILKDLFPNG